MTRQDQHAVTAETYARAERLLEHHRAELALRIDVEPNWIEEGSRFWYRVETEAGARFVVADPEAGERRDAFDHDAVAASLARATGEPADPRDLPFAEIDVDAAGVVRFDAAGARWRWDAVGARCLREPRGPRSILERESPDGRWAVRRTGYDLEVRSVASDEVIALTRDGTAASSYGTHPDHAVPWTSLARRTGGRMPPVVRWSPDSRRVLFHRTEQEGVGEMYLVDAAPEGGGRPRLERFSQPMPGDEVRPRGEWLVYDVDERRVLPSSGERFELFYLSPLTRGSTWWGADGRTVYSLRTTRDRRTLDLLALDAETGATRLLIRETGATRVEANQWGAGAPLVRIVDDGARALWYSQRDGRGHLFLYDLVSGELVRQVTRGDFVVTGIAGVDEETRRVYAVVAGLDDDPCLRSLVEVGLDEDGFRRLTSPGVDHRVAMPPHCRWFVDAASTTATPPVTTVRDLAGAELLDLERGDVSRLIAAGWTPPERIRALAADGETELVGLLHLPPGFDPGRRYPVVDHVYPGPQVARVPPSFSDPLGMAPLAEALAALGLVVLALDGRGTPGRDKAFHDHSYRNLGGAGAIEDHVAVLRQLAATRPWLDLDRVGIVGHSGGGFAAARAMLTFPDVFRVGVAQAGNHDNRIYHAQWAETYDGPYDPSRDESLSNTLLAANLEGRLLLIHGGRDDNVPPHHSLRLVEALVAADKDVDLVIIPGADHGFDGYEHYLTRRTWDFLVRHLLGSEPPPFRLAPVPEPPGRLARELGILF